MENFGLTQLEFCELVFYSQADRIEAVVSVRVEVLIIFCS